MQFTSLYKHTGHFTFAVLMLFSVSCKKDILYWQIVQKIDSHSQTDRLNKVLFKDSLNGYIFGGNWYVDAVILTTKDGGNTWARTSYPNAGQLLISGTVSPGGSIYSCGFEGKLMYKAASDSAWKLRQLEHYWFRDIAFTDESHAIIIGGISFNSGMIQHIDNAGSLLKRDSLDYQLNEIKMVSATTGYCCGYGIVLKTTDGGQTWATQNIAGDNFMAMYMRNNEIWICGYYGSIFHTSDSGEHWDKYRDGSDITQARYRLMDILFTDNLHGWAVGEDGRIIYSNDAGRHWAEYQQFTTSPLYSIAENPNGTLFVAGDLGTLYKITPQ